MKVIATLTTIFDVVAVVLIVAGAFVLGIGLGLIASGLALGAGSIALDRAAEAEQKKPK